MKKIFNLISSIFFIGLPILATSCTPTQEEDTQIINLNNYSLTDDEYEFKTSLWQHLDPYYDSEHGVGYHLFSNEKYRDDEHIITTTDNKFMLNNVKSYFGFSMPVNNEYSYNDSLNINNTMSDFSKFYSLLEKDLFKKTICGAFFGVRDKDFYIKKGFPENLIDAFIDKSLEWNKFYNYDEKTNKLELLNETNFYQFIKELVDNKNVENNDVWVTIDYNYSLTETVDNNENISDYEQTFRIRLEPNPNKDFTWHNGSKNAIVFWFDTNIR